MMSRRDLKDVFAQYLVNYYLANKPKQTPISAKEFQEMMTSLNDEDADGPGIEVGDQIIDLANAKLRNSLH